MINLIAEIGINHNGSLDIAKQLIDCAVVAGFDYVKFQKRTPELCVPVNQRYKIKNTPWGAIPYIDYKKKIEFEFDEYSEIAKYCQDRSIEWFASVWDLESAKFMCNFSEIVKIPSALITNYDLLALCRELFETVIISTGMSTEEEIEKAVEIGLPDVIMHTNSSYPTKIEELNLGYIEWLIYKYEDRQIGYSGHEFGLATTFATVTMGIEWIERHITLDHDMWGSDQKASVDPVGMMKLVRGVRDIEKALDGYCEREVSKSEFEKRKTLRGM